MSVRDRAFRRYPGPLTPRRWRFLVLWRYGRREVFRSRWITALYALSFTPVLVAAVILYLRHNLPALEAMELDVTDLVKVDARFFAVVLRVQAFLAFLLTTLVGPGLVSPDLANNGLPLYLCRPFSRAEYVLGKMSVLLILTSTVTWLPLGLLVAIQALLEPGWMAASWNIPLAVVLGSLVWIVVLALMALALSAWIKWRILAAAMMFATLVVASGVAEFVNALFGTRWGDLLSPAKLAITVWERLLFGAEALLADIPLLPAGAGLAAFGLLCLLVLHLKLRAYEVVR